MSARDILKRIEKERASLKEELYSLEGLERLQNIMASYEGEDKLVWWQDIEKEMESKPELENFKTGIDPLDKLTGGFRRKQIITMFAHTKHGKTEMAVWLQSLFPQLSPVMIPLEQSAEELISQRKERGYTIPVILSPRHHDAFVSTEWIEERIVEGIAKQDTGMVVIDHLGYIDTLGTHARENLAFRIGQIMKQLHFFATKWNVCIVLLSHISEGDEGKPPLLQDLANSSDIKKESDTVIAIWRKNSLKKKIRVYENRTMLSVLANRRFGRNGNVGLGFDEKTGTFYEDNKWVESMIESAERDVKAENAYDDYTP